MEISAPNWKFGETKTKQEEEKNQVWLWDFIKMEKREDGKIGDRDSCSSNQEEQDGL